MKRKKRQRHWINFELIFKYTLNVWEQQKRERKEDTQQTDLIRFLFWSRNNILKWFFDHSKKKREREKKWICTQEDHIFFNVCFNQVQLYHHQHTKQYLYSIFSMVHVLYDGFLFEEFLFVNVLTNKKVNILVIWKACLVLLNILCYT